MGDWRFYQQQAIDCLALTRSAATPREREVYLRLAWHWRQIARAARELDRQRKSAKPNPPLTLLQAGHRDSHLPR